MKRNLLKQLFSYLILFSIFSDEIWDQAEACSIGLIKPDEKNLNVLSLRLECRVLVVAIQ